MIQLHDGGTNSKERSQTFGEVFTPQWMVEKMCDLLEQENQDPENTFNCYSPASTFLDPACGEGQFPLEVLRRKFRNCHKKADFETAALSVWGIDIQPDNVEICISNVLTLCREHFRVSKKLEQEIRQHYILGDSLKILPLLIRYGEGHEIVYVRGENLSMPDDKGKNGKKGEG